MDSAEKRCYVAFDVSKETLMMAAPKGLPQGLLKNSPDTVDKRLKALLDHANKVHETLWLVCEATGGYQRTLEACAAKAGVPISVVPPAWIFHAKKSWGKLAKTDPLDAACILRYAQQEKPDATPYDPGRYDFQELVSSKDLLVRERAKLRQRSQTVTVVAAKKALACAEAALDEQIAALNAEIASVLNERAKTDVRIEAIRPLEGVGPRLLAVLHAYLPELGKVGRKQISSLAGVVPQARDSGKLQGRRYVYGGKRVVRTALYAACICFLRKNSPYRARYDALRARNKSHRTVLIAMAHDLIIRINAVARQALEEAKGIVTD